LKFSEKDFGDVQSVLDADPNGLPHILSVNHSENSGKLFYTYPSVRDGVKPDLVTDLLYTTFLDFADIKVDPEGKAHIVFYHNTHRVPLPPATVYILEYRVWKDGKEVDSSQIRARTNQRDVSGLSLSLDSNNNPHIIFSTAGVAMVYATLDNKKWVEETIDSFTAPSPFCYPGISIDHDNTPHVVYYRPIDGQKGEIIYQRKNKQSGKWELQSVAIAKVPHLATLDTGGYFALDSKGLPYISYLDENGKPVLAHLVSGAEIKEWDYDDSVRAAGFLALDQKDRPYILTHNEGNMEIRFFTKKFEWQDLPLNNKIKFFRGSFDLDDKGFMYFSFTPDPRVQGNATPFGYAKSYFPITKVADVLDEATVEAGFQPQDQDVPVGQEFTVNVDISGVEQGLTGFELQVHFNPEVLEVVTVDEGDFLKQDGAQTLFGKKINNKAGSISDLFSFRTDLRKGTGVTGNGTLAKITFKAVKVGKSTLSLQNIVLTDPNNEEILTVPPQSGEITVRESFLPWDLNSDGVVDILDLVQISTHFGEKPPKDLKMDLLKDGVINIRDLIEIARHFGEKANPAAPGAVQMPGTRHEPLLKRWIDETRVVNDGSIAFQKGIAALEKLLAAIVPEKTVLLSNYPNPFNPETWIPYRLAETSLVALRIYDITGNFVRTITVGYQPPGRYESKEKAIYWDGRNDFGERVSSGTYFYTLTVENFTATRKMLILK